ncbi:MAG: hypothetical protein ACRBF0_23115 [Calditrichia bacterium]
MSTTHRVMLERLCDTIATAETACQAQPWVVPAGTARISEEETARLQSDTMDSNICSFERPKEPNVFSTRETRHPGSDSSRRSSLKKENV